MSKRVHSTNLPPSINVGTLETGDEAFPSTERELAAYLYLKHGQGTYTVLVHTGVMRSAWRGDVEYREELSGEEYVLFQAQEKNRLEYYTGIREVTDPEKEDDWGRVDDPEKVVPDFLH